MKCPIHNTQMTMLFYGHVCDICDPPRNSSKAIIQSNGQYIGYGLFGKSDFSRIHDGELYGYSSTSSTRKTIKEVQEYRTIHHPNSAFTIHKLTADWDFLGDENHNRNGFITISKQYLDAQMKMNSKIPYQLIIVSEEPEQE